MKGFIKFSCLVLLLFMSSITVNAGVLKEATNKTYADYVHKYNSIKKVAEQYENNIVLTHSDSYFFGLLGDLGDSVTEEEIKKYKEPLGKYNTEFCVTYLGLNYNDLKSRLEKYNEGDLSVRFSDVESTATSFFDYDFKYYYDTVNNVVIQYVTTGFKADDDEWHDNIEYYIWDEKGDIVSYEKYTE